MPVVAPPQIEVSADLRFSVELPGHGPVRGTVVGSGNRLEVRLDDPAYFAGGRDAGHLRALASALAERDITVVVKAGDTTLLEIGATDPPWWQRRLSRSRHLKVVSVRGAVTGAIGRVRGATAEAVLPTRDLVPPTTLLPLAPTFGRADRRVTTTHDPRRAGNPRLVLSASNRGLPDDARIVFPLLAETTTIGSGAGCDIRLPELEPLHAVVVHDGRDEFVVRRVAARAHVLVHGAVVQDDLVLRTGARLTVGPWTLAFRRAEYADHGRPFGGRIGGEAGHQRSQPPAPADGAGSDGGGPTVVLDPQGPR
ncbi:hypothetical protein ABIE44_003110 [Marmoricola sp. OAE513]|uniref:FHA domain-containing protein n=1 Tax=Marmoricola sp. OAE513 TaxID=2817894 RepID=UPI001AEA27D1